MSTRRRHRDESGMLSLEAVMVLPVLALLLLVLLEVAGLVRDVLVLHEAARAGVRVAATTTGAAAPTEAARAAAPELSDVRVRVSPHGRRDGDLVRVEVSVTRRVGPVSHTLRARSVARVEPAVGRLPGL